MNTLHEEGFLLFGGAVEGTLDVFHWSNRCEPDPCSPLRQQRPPARQADCGLTVRLGSFGQPNLCGLWNFSGNVFSRTSSNAHSGECHQVHTRHIIVLGGLMRLESSIVIRRTPEQVGRFLANIANIEKWDRGVGSTRPTSSSHGGVGFEFETLGHSDAPNSKPEKMRMAYRIVRAESDSCTVALVSSTGNARFFRTAQWHFRLSPTSEGSLLTCCADFTLRLRYFFLAPILFLKRSALQMDLQALKRAVETG